MKNDLDFSPKELRMTILEMAYNGQSAHIACAFSIVEILSTLYRYYLNYPDNDPESKERDYLILSKGHAGIGLYCILSDRGLFEEKHLFELNNGGLLGEHPDANIPGIEVVGGSLGHGLGIACGMAKADKLNLNPRKYFVLMGDGELYEGSVWEVALSAPKFKLNNFTVYLFTKPLGK